MRTEIRNTLAGVLAAGVLLLLLVPGAVRVTPRYAELEGADPEVLARLRAAWPEEGFRSPLRGEKEHAGAKRFAELVRSLGRDAGLPLLRLLVEEYERKDKESSSWYIPDQDERRELPFWLLGELRDPALNAPLVRMLRDRDLHIEGRRGAAIALSWPGNREPLPALLDLALDRREEKNDLRLAVVHRLTRIGPPAPTELRRLLHEPFGREGRIVPWGPRGETVTLFGNPRAIDRIRRRRHVLRGRALLLQGDAAEARKELAAAEAIGPVEREIRKLRRDLETAEAARGN